MPVAVEHPVQGLQVLRGSDGGLLGVRTLVDVPIGLQAVILGRRPHELPRPLRAGFRQRVGLETALDDRDVGQIQRQPLGAEDVLDHRQVLRPAGQALLHVVAQTAAQEFDGGQNLRILRNGHVVLGRGQVGLDRFLGRRPGVGPREGGNRQDLVDRRGLGLRFREAVALRERRDLVSVDTVDKTIEMLPHPRVGPGAVWRLQQHVDRPIELDAGALEMPELQLALTGGEMVLRGLDQRGDGIGSGRAGLHRRHGRRARRRGDRGFLNFRVRTAGCGDHQNDRQSETHQGPGQRTNEHLGAPARSRRRWNCVRALLRFAPLPGGSCFIHHRLDRAAELVSFRSPRKRNP